MYDTNKIGDGVVLCESKGCTCDAVDGGVLFDIIEGNGVGTSSIFLVWQGNKRWSCRVMVLILQYYCSGRVMVLILQYYCGGRVIALILQFRLIV